MADFSMAAKRTYSVYIRVGKSEGQDVLRREQYNIVEYDVTDPNRLTFIEGLPDPGLRLMLDPTKDVQPAGLVHGVRIYDSPPFPWARMGYLQ